LAPRPKHGPPPFPDTGTAERGHQTPRHPSGIASQNFSASIVTIQQTHHLCSHFTSEAEFGFIAGTQKTGGGKLLLSTAHAAGTMHHRLPQRAIRLFA